MAFSYATCNISHFKDLESRLERRVSSRICTFRFEKPFSGLWPKRLMINGLIYFVKIAYCTFRFEALRQTRTVLPLVYPGRIIIGVLTMNVLIMHDRDKF